MIDSAVSFIASEVNAYFKARTDSAGNVVVLSGVVDEAGKYAIPDDHIAAALVNIEEETVLKEQLPEFKYVNGRHEVLEPRIKLNLFILFAAKFTIYEQALKHISHVLAFFQSHRIFTRDSYPALGKPIERLAVDLQRLSYDELNQVWAFLGGKHLPSIVYKVRLVSIQDEAQARVQPPLTIIETRVGNS